MHKQFNKKEIKTLGETLHYFSYDFASAKKIVQKDNFLFVDETLAFFLQGTQWIPSLRLLIKQQFLKQVVIDMPAIPYITNGADVMRPGIVAFDNTLLKNEIAVIVDQNHKKPLAVGRMLFSGEEMASLSSGKAVKNLHYVGDDIWKKSTSIQ